MRDVNAFNVGAALLAARRVPFGRRMRRRHPDQLSAVGVRRLAGGWGGQPFIDSLATSCASDQRNPLSPLRLGISSRPKAL